MASKINMGALVIWMILLLFVPELLLADTAVASKAATPSLTPDSALTHDSGLSQLKPAQVIATKKILVVGDSLSAGYRMPIDQGWVALLEQELIDRGLSFSVDNVSISGETARLGVRRLKAHLARTQPEWVILELGANDALRGTPAAEIKKNLAQMITLSQQSGAKLLLLGVRLPPNYGERYTRQFEAIYSELAQQFSILLLPYLLEGISTDLSLMQEDQMHPTATAQPIVLKNVWKVLGPALEGSD